MMKKITFLLCLLGCVTSGLIGQHLQGLVAKFSQQIAKTPGTFRSMEGVFCEPDSIHGYYYLTPTDSVLYRRQIFKKYESTAATAYTYEFTTSPLQLYAIDSVVFNGMGQPVFNQYWEFDYDSNAVVLKERMFCFPHMGPVQTDYFFPQAILNTLESNRHHDAAFDSVTLHTRNFFSGMLEQDEKTVYLYSPSGQLQEEQIFSGDPFGGSTTWFNSSKTNYDYTASGRIGHIEEYEWNGSDFILQTTAEYSYDANDSLMTAISTDETSGLPEEKLEMSYQSVEKSTSATFFSWNEDSQQWVESLYLYGDYDNQGRWEVIETRIGFFGITESYRYEYVYLDSGNCPGYIQLYEQGPGGTWEFIERFYYFPNFVTSVPTPEVLAWSVHPNPARDGIRVKAPQGTFLQIVTMQGVVLYRSYASGMEEYIDLENAPNQLFLSASDGNVLTTRVILVLE